MTASTFPQQHKKTPKQLFFLFCSAGRSWGHTCTTFPLGKNPRGAPSWCRTPQKTLLPFILGQLLASLGHPVCRKTSGSCRGLRERANRSPCVRLIRAQFLQQFRPRSPRCLPVPWACALSFFFLFFFGYFGFSEGTGALKGGREGAGLKARSRFACEAVRPFRDALRWG